MTQSDFRIAFVGGGNMGGSILTGLLDSGAPAHSFLLVDPDEGKRQPFAMRGVSALPSADARLGAAEMVLFAVKPQVMSEVVAGLKQHLHPEQLLLSVVAGVSSDAIERMAGGPRRVVRAMPNVPALHLAGMTGLYANSAVSDAERAFAESTLAVVGDTEWFDDEAMIDTVTAVSGSGPAYFFYLMEVMQSQAEALGMRRDAARRLVAATAHGAALMVKHSDTEFSQLRHMVTSKRGTTEAAVTTFDREGAREAFAKGIQSSWQRSKELGAEFNG